MELSSPNESKFYLSTGKEFSDSTDEKKSTNSLSSNNLNSVSRRKQLKQHNEELEKHMRKQQSENEFFRQDSFLKKFSTRSQQVNENSITEYNTPLSSRKSKRSNYRFSCKTLNGPSSRDESNSLISTKNEVSIPENSVCTNNLNQINMKTFSQKTKSKNRFNFLNKKFSITSQASSCSTKSHTTVDSTKNVSIFDVYFQKILLKCNYFVISPDDNCMFAWLIILNMCILYNGWLIIARQSFENLQTMFSFYWKIADAVSDSIYLLDIFVHFRTGYLEQGLLVYDSRKLAINYLKSRNFLLDIFSLLPFELLQIKYGYNLPMLRFPRFFKVYRSIQLYYMTESRTLYPNVWRVTNLTHILFLLGHWFAGFYFLISKAEGFKGHWSYPEPVDEFALLPRMYLRCLYWSTLTLTTIGDLPPPETNWQWLKEMSNFRYLFSIAVHYLAVFVIALIVGQVGNVITNRNANRVEFERLLDGAKQYMRNHNVPSDMQKRVQRWYDYSWSRGRMNGAGDIHSIGLLPDKLKTELALHVNLETLRKVTIFQECQPEFLHDLVLKMRAYIFTPGDMICRKGEVAREMFIIADGVLEVIGESGQVLTKMYSGDFFGEIGILNIEGASNRRTADVRSVGYAELFSLSKEDVLSAVKDYPDAERILIEYGKRRLNQKTSSSASNSKTNLNKILAESTSKENSIDEKQPIANTHQNNNQQIVNKERKMSLDRKGKKFDSDIELGLNIINEENRGLTTDMLGLPTSNKTAPEILISSLNLPEMNKITMKEEILEKQILHSKNSKSYDYLVVLEGLDELLNSCNKNENDENKIESIEDKIVKLKEYVSETKDAKIQHLEDLILQKEAKIKLLDSRIKILQKYITLNDNSGV